MTDHDNPLDQQVHNVWETKAAFWDENMGDDGNRFHQTLVSPAMEKLLNVQQGESVLDVACGSGVFARRLVDLGAQVVACDFSQAFIDIARKRKHGDRIDFRLIDAIDEAALLTLGAGRYDAITCNMALMDMVTIEPLLQTIPRLLKAGGRFLFSVPHPCFNQTDAIRVRELSEHNAQEIEIHALKIMGYIQPAAQLGIGMVGEPVPHHYFHRPISMLFNACFEAGMVLDGIEEPVPDFDEDSPSWSMWMLPFKHLPPVLVARLRVLPK